MKDCNVNSAFFCLSPPPPLSLSTSFFLPPANCPVYNNARHRSSTVVPPKRIKFVKLAVSFYGASYIHLPVQEAKGATDISFRFRTHLADAMLLLAAGKTDYCLIKLEAGRLKVRLPSALTSINRLSVWCRSSRRR